MQIVLLFESHIIEMHCMYTYLPGKSKVAVRMQCSQEYKFHLPLTRTQNLNYTRFHFQYPRWIMEVAPHPFLRLDIICRERMLICQMRVWCQMSMSCNEFEVASHQLRIVQLIYHKNIILVLNISCSLTKKNLMRQPLLIKESSYLLTLNVSRGTKVEPIIHFCGFFDTVSTISCRNMVNWAFL